MVEVTQEDRRLSAWLARRSNAISILNKTGIIDRMIARHRTTALAAKEAENAELRAKVEKLRGALKPFAKSGDLLVMAGDSGNFWAYRPAGGDEYGITGTHLLEARATLAETQP